MYIYFYLFRKYTSMNVVIKEPTGERKEKKEHPMNEENEIKRDRKTERKTAL